MVAQSPKQLLRRRRICYGERKKHITPPPPLADQTQTHKRKVKYREREDSQRNAVPDYAASTQYTHSGGQTPQEADAVHRNPDDGVHAECAQQRAYHNREECVADHTDGLKERAIARLAIRHLPLTSYAGGDAHISTQ